MDSKAMSITGTAGERRTLHTAAERCILFSGARVFEDINADERRFMVVHEPLSKGERLLVWMWLLRRWFNAWRKP